MVLKVIGIIVLVVLILFIVTFAMYFFNLDMKLTSALAPWFDKHYDRIDRDKHL